MRLVAGNRDDEEEKYIYIGTRTHRVKYICQRVSIRSDIRSALYRSIGRRGVKSVHGHRTRLPRFLSRCENVKRLIERPNTDV